MDIASLLFLNVFWNIYIWSNYTSFPLSSSPSVYGNCHSSSTGYFMCFMSQISSLQFLTVAHVVTVVKNTTTTTLEQIIRTCQVTLLRKNAIRRPCVKVKKKKILLEYLAVRNYEDHMTLLFCVALCSGTQYNRHIYKKEVAGVFQDTDAQLQNVGFTPAKVEYAGMLSQGSCRPGLIHLVKCKQRSRRNLEL